VLGVKDPVEVHRFDDHWLSVFRVDVFNQGHEVAVKNGRDRVLSEHPPLLLKVVRVDL
jgi:hypothetical protein